MEKRKLISSGTVFSEFPQPPENLIPKSGGLWVFEDNPISVVVFMKLESADDTGVGALDDVVERR